MVVYVQRWGLLPIDPPIDFHHPIRLPREHALLALKHGKHVLVEKPVACTAADAEAIVQEVGSRLAWALIHLARSTYIMNACYASSTSMS